MSIFSRRDSIAPPSAAAGGSAETASTVAPASAQRRRVTHIAPGSRIQGQITGPTELLVEGEVEGEIRVEAAVMIGSEGVVQGPIRAQAVRVSGRVVGSVQATERVEIGPTGSLEGDIAAPRVVIAEGAFFKGRVEMKGDKAEKEKGQREKERDRGNEPRRNSSTTSPEAGT